MGRGSYPRASGVVGVLTLTSRALVTSARDDLREAISGERGGGVVRGMVADVLLGMATLGRVGVILLFRVALECSSTLPFMRGGLGGGFLRNITLGVDGALVD